MASTTTSGTLGLIWAQNLDGVIGAGGTIPFTVPEDMAHFKALTVNCPVIMGQATWESLPERFRPLPERLNVVLTEDSSWAAPGAIVAYSIPQALELTAGVPLAWVIGGGSVYAQFKDLANRAEVTVVDTHGPGDTLAPVLDGAWHRVNTEPATGWATSRAGLRYRFESWLNPAAASPASFL